MWRQKGRPAAYAKESLELPEAGRTKVGTSPSDFQRGQACPHLDLALGVFGL